jgi:hypothetical protein
LTPRAVDLAVDIIVNNHNYERFLGDAIESARRQTHEKVGVTVVDDGSTDGSHELLEDLGSDVRVVLKENGGQASALNAGMEGATGDVVIFLDADDVLRPEAAARAVAAFAADESAVKVQFRMDVIDAGGRPTGELKPAPHLRMPQGDMRAAELAYPFDLTWMAMSGNAFRASALERIMPIPAGEYPVSGADWYLVHLMALLGDVISLDEVLASYRVHGGNSYELSEAEPSVEHLRKAIERTRPTARALLRLAAELQLPHPDRILSLADLANRMASLKLDPGLHPVPGDRPGALFRDSIGAARRRTDVSAPMKLMFVGWFGAMALAPRPVATRLAALFLFPERRGPLNRILRRLSSEPR